MLWALGRLEKLPPRDETVSHELLKTYPYANIEAVLEEARVRDHAEIKDARDFAEIFHWRSRTNASRARA